jgi:dephospho-CoA kinase
MPVIGITGGVASGKSRAAAELKPHFEGAQWFSADGAVLEIYADDADVAAELRTLFGERALTPHGVDRDWIRSRVFAQPDLREALNAVVHPRVRERWVTSARKARESKRWFFAEIPLLFETDGQALCDQVVVVACSVQTQIRRMMRERNLSEALARQIIEAQWPAERKVALGDVLLWNDSTPPCLQRQVQLLAHRLHNTYA